MKYIKNFESVSYHGTKKNKLNRSINFKPKFRPYLYPIVKEDVNEMYEYLSNLDANPMAYKITPDLIKPKGLGFDIYHSVKDKDYLLYFESNDKVPDYIINRSFGVFLSLSKLELDEKKEEEMKLYLMNKKYNL